MTTDSNPITGNARIADRRLAWAGLGLILATYLGVGVIRYISPDDLGFRDQQAPASYVTDVVENDNWLCPRDAHGRIASKPPMHPWIAAVAAHAMGGVSRPALLFPSYLSMLILTITIYAVGRRSFGREAALLASMTFLICHISPKMMGIVRTDALFACVVLLNALAALRIWETGRGWNLFWFIALINTLVKGPLGVILALSGLLAVLWERGRGHPGPFGRAMLPGLVVWAAASGGWLFASWRVFGDEVIYEMIGRELLRHAATGDAGEWAILRFWQAPLYLMTRYAPWSFFTIAEIIRVVRRPADDDVRRRFERFLVCWIGAGLAIFSLAGHQRPDLIFPLVAPSAWLAGRALARAAWLVTPRRVLAFVGVLAAVALPALALIYRLHYPNHPDVRMGLATKRMGDALRAEVGAHFPLVHASAPLSLQIHQGLWLRYATDEIACDLLKKEEPVFVAVRSYPAFLETCRRSGATAHLNLQWHDGASDRSVAIIGNRERLDWYDPIGGWFAPFATTYRGIRPAGGPSDYLDKTGTLRNGGAFALSDRGGALTASNVTDRPATLRLELRQGDRVWREEHAVAGGSTLDLSWPGSAQVADPDRPAPLPSSVPAAGTTRD